MDFGVSENSVDYDGFGYSKGVKLCKFIGILY